MKNDRTASCQYIGLHVVEDETQHEVHVALQPYTAGG